MVAAERFDDPENARTILLMAGGLVLLGVLVAVGTVWWWRSTEVEHPALGPLEVMSTRKWWNGDYNSRHRRLEAARPVGAEAAAGPADEPVDLQAVERDDPPQFDDLADAPAADLGLGLDAAALHALRNTSGAGDDAEVAAIDTDGGPAADDDAADSDGAGSDGAEADGTPDEVRAPMDPLLRSTGE